jgi:hypothetical protein
MCLSYFRNIINALNLAFINLILKAARFKSPAQNSNLARQCKSDMNYHVTTA